jgi:predicted CoA-binding protein
VVGDVLNSSKVASRLGPRLARNGKEVWFVNPSSKTVVTDTLKRKLADVPATIEVVDLIINPAVGITIIEEMSALGIKNVFIQPGAASAEILDLCASSGIEVFQGCVLNAQEPFLSDTE